jgi:hypothetical protein
VLFKPKRLIIDISLAKARNTGGYNGDVVLEIATSADVDKQQATEIIQGHNKGELFRLAMF